MLSNGLKSIDHQSLFSNKDIQTYLTIEENFNKMKWPKTHTELERIECCLNHLPLWSNSLLKMNFHNTIFSNHIKCIRRFLCPKISITGKSLEPSGIQPEIFNKNDLLHSMYKQQSSPVDVLKIRAVDRFRSVVSIPNCHNQ